MSVRQLIVGILLPIFIWGSARCSVYAAETDAQPVKIQILYLGKDYPESQATSLLDDLVKDNGSAGARVGIDEINVGGRFMGKSYELIKMIIPSDGDVAAVSKAALVHGTQFIVADLQSSDLKAVSDLSEAKGAIILDSRTSDDSARQVDCRNNVFHVLPNWAMRADALAQYLIWKKWQRWFLVSGTSPADKAFAADVKRAANRFGAKIVDERTYDYQVGSARATGGHEQIQEQIPEITQTKTEYDVLIVADIEDTFGDYLLFSSWKPRLVAGTHGLVAVAWHRSFEHFAAEEMQRRFHQAVSRYMTERDYGVWLSFMVLGEAISRSGKTDSSSVKSYILSDQFSVSGFKGEGLNFRHWDHQLRQPVIITGPRMLVSVSPQEGFLHSKFHTDTLGFDEPESACRMVQ